MNFLKENKLEKRGASSVGHVIERERENREHS